MCVIPTKDSVVFRVSGDDVDAVIGYVCGLKVLWLYKELTINTKPSQLKLTVQNASGTQALTLREGEKSRVEIQKKSL